VLKKLSPKKISYKAQIGSHNLDKYNSIEVMEPIDEDEKKDDE
jgi:hypothetical protein